jgi:hypothetical protein
MRSRNKQTINLVHAKHVRHHDQTMERLNRQLLLVGPRKASGSMSCNVMSWLLKERRTGGEHGWMREEGLAANRDGNFSAAVVA